MIYKTKKEIDFRIKILAKQIADSTRGESDPIVLMCVMKGGYMFFSDLAKQIGENGVTNVEIDFIGTRSYDGKHQGGVELVSPHRSNVAGKRVFLIDDFFDTGNTLTFIADMLSLYKPAGIELVTLLTRKSSPEPKYNLRSAFVCDNEWFAGYGMDDIKGERRNDPNLYVIGNSPTE